MRQMARASAWRSQLSRGQVPSRVVREEAAPILLYGWDNDATQMVAFGMVGGVIGQLIGNPTIP